MPKPRGRPPSLKAREDILRAAAELIERGGVGAVTMEAVARAAGVGKPTVYRNFPDREALAMAALMASGGIEARVARTPSALDDFHRQVRKIAQVLATPRGRNVALMVAASDADSELAKAFRNQVMQASRDAGRGLLQRAVETGELPAGTPTEVVLDMVYGAIFYRLLMGHAEADSRFVAELVGTALGRAGS